MTEMSSKLILITPEILLFIGAVVVAVLFLISEPRHSFWNIVAAISFSSASAFLIRAISALASFPLTTARVFVAAASLASAPASLPRKL